MPYSQIVHATCKQCDQPFTYRWRKEGREFCSQACYYAARADAVPRVTCAQCGTTFTAPPAVIARGGGKYCSEECQYIARRVPVEDRFWTKVDKNGPIPSHRPELGPCWVWTAHCDDYGYGVIGIDGGKLDKAHRVSYRMEHGSIPEGKEVCHHCDNPPCVRPDHLFAGTRQANMLDSVSKDRHGVKLSLDDVREIRRRAGEGESTASLARAFGINVRNMRDVISGRYYTYIE